MKLRSKLFYSIFIVLFLQIILIAGFSLFTFYRQARNASRADLLSSFRDARLSLEMLKNRLMNNIHFLRFYFTDRMVSAGTPDLLNKSMYEYFTSIQADWIFMLDKNNRFVVDVRKHAERVSAIVHQIDHFHFRYPRNEFLVSRDLQGSISLFLITGTALYREDGTLFRVYIINRIDKKLIDSLNKETGINVGFFIGTEYICSDLTHFPLPETGYGEMMTLAVSSVPYLVFGRTISVDIPRGLSLVVLKSTLGDRISLLRIVYVFVVTFLITLVVSFLIVAWMTGVLLSPLYRLRQWLETYMKDDRIEPLAIHTGDEIGFITNTFHTMVSKLIKEEQIIKEQLTQISFLHRYTDTIVKNLQAGIIVCNKSEEIEYVNPYFCALVNRAQESVLHGNVNDVIAAHFTRQEGDSRLANTGIMIPGVASTLQYVQANGEVLRFMARIVPITRPDEDAKILVVLEDVTKTERLWHKILVAEKIASLGFLSAGMAHEINNPLGSILSHVNYLTEVEDDPEKLDSLKWIETETKRIAAIIGRVLSFARSDNKSDSTDVNRVISETAALMKIDFEQKRVRIDTHLETGCPDVRINTNEFRQAVINLFLNAEQAIDGDGRISIETVKRNGHVRIILSDNGCGIGENELPHVFDPFFTTNRGRGGTGLGLSITYNIIRRAGGDISIESVVGKGTTVVMTLPCEGGNR
ncbi:MAG: PAS domain-containing protein [Spirochaetales bacterium]|nr:PAS domain-containing protein [Spirochaetales bacterium]